MTTDGMALFKEKHKFMHALFDKVMQIDRGKRHEREYKIDFNAQSAHEKLNIFCAKSTKSHADVSDTLSHITSAKIKSWKGTAEAFILHWQD